MNKTALTHFPRNYFKHPTTNQAMLSIMHPMIRRIALSLVFIATTLPPSLRADDSKESKPMDTTAFAADLYAKLSTNEGNLFFSPTSIETALAMTYAGANGNTAGQMAKTLHFNGNAEQVTDAFGKLLKKLNHPPEFISGFDQNNKPVTSPAYELAITNALWGQQGYPFEAGYTSLVEQHFGAGLHAVDYRQTEQARKTINDWVSEQTKDKIKDLIGKGDLTPDTRLVLTNAVYFKSSWATRFSKYATKDEPFHLSAEKSIDVPLMHQRGDFQYMENADLQLLQLPYTQGELSMVILLPKQIDGLAQLEKSLTSANLQQWLDDSKPESVRVTIPKFTFTAELRLPDVLQKMGMTDAFNPDKADFSGMSSAERFFISQVIHKAFVAVDEEGTEAAAATAISAVGAAAMRQPREPKIFTADHPFLFLIRHNPTGEPLFLGRLVNPA